MSDKQQEDGFTDVELAPLKRNNVEASRSSSPTPASAATTVIKSSSNTLPHHQPPMNLTTSKRTNNNVISAMAMYSFCSISMVLTNKSLASSYNDRLGGADLNVLLVVFQAIVTVISVEACRQLKWVEYPPLRWRTARLWAPVNLMFCLMLVSGMAALQHNSIPMVTIYKNITNLIVTLGDYLLFGSRPQGLVLIAFGILLVGAIVAAVQDPYISFIGIFSMVSNCVITAGYILWMKFATKQVKLSKFGMVYYNHVLCLIFLVPIAWLRGDVDRFLSTPSLHTWDYGGKNILAGFVSFFLNFASLNFVAAAGPTTYAIVGSANKVPLAVLGYILFDDIIVPITTLCWIVVSMGGGFLYSYAKIRSSSRRQTVRAVRDGR